MWNIIYKDNMKIFNFINNNIYFISICWYNTRTHNWIKSGVHFFSFVQKYIYIHIYHIKNIDFFIAVSQIDRMCRKASKTILDKWNKHWLYESLSLKGTVNRYVALYSSGYISGYIENRLIAKICLSSTMSIIPIECQWPYKHHTLLIPHEP